MLFLQERRYNAELFELLKAREERSREKADAERQHIAEERRLYAEERRRAEQRMVEQHLAIMALIAKLSDAIDRNRSGHGPRQP